MEKCANCERIIGNLETPMLFQEKVVCPQCHASLAASSPKPIEPLDYAPSGFGAWVDRQEQTILSEPDAPVDDPSSGPVRSCPICGSTRPPRRRSKGSCLVLLILLLLFLLPGVLYAMFFSGHVWVCPDCHATLGEIG
jgi:hypothetical protein